VRFIRSAIFIVAVLIFPALSMFAQENEPQVVDEVVAQINDGVITLSQVRREMKNAIESLVQEGGKTPEVAKAEVEGRKGEIIASLINEELLLQKAKDMDMDSQIEAEVNGRIKQIMAQQGIKTLEILNTKMREQGINPDDFRENMRRSFTKDMVLQGEVDRIVYQRFTTSEIKAYYESHKDKLIKPETYTISEIFLNFAGRDTDAVKSKAYQLVSQLRKGGDFVQIAIENSERPDVKTDKGRIGTFTMQQIKETSELFVKPLQATKVGGVTDPIITEEGVEIFRLDEKKEANYEFDEGVVRGAMTYEKLPEERKKYLAGLRRDGFVKVSETYRALVEPFLPKDETSTAEVKKDEPKKTDSKKKN
jgi:peptidyl-prolyl cis-trans isomerase SurA